jgi:hypothetical protein
MEHSQMLIKPLIRYANQITIKTHLCGSALVSYRQQDGLALWIEGVGNTPCASIGIKSQFLHVRVARALKRICIWPSEQRAILAEDYCGCLQLFPNRLGQLPDFHRKFIVEVYRPLHFHIMLSNA